MRSVLMVAEKPSLAQGISEILSDKTASQRRHGRGLAVYEWRGRFPPYNETVQYRMTSVAGHVYSCDFPPKYQDWSKTDELDLFKAETVKKENSSEVVHHLRNESKGCDTVVLWLDCDREGENICFEVLQCVKANIYRPDNIFRAKFSAITKTELGAALNHLGRPNKCLSDSVDARQELDLKVGCAFTRFQTKFFQGKYGNLDATVVSYGPCQTPTLGFCVQRHDEIVNFKEEPFWRINVMAGKDGFVVPFDWDRGRVFDELVCSFLHKSCQESKTARVLSVDTVKDSKGCPTALNTVELLKVA
eukprot:PhF_6_TR587/c0_g1_i2/m.645/K03165/TOP3; DNA topoisomerase III